jgi:hypothetical protein
MFMRVYNSFENVKVSTDMKFEITVSGAREFISGF